MRWNKEVIDTFNTQEQTDALLMAKEIANKISNYRTEYEETKKEISKISKKMNFIINGFSGISLIFAAVLTFLIIEFIFRIIMTVILCLLIFGGYSAFYSSSNREGREELSNQLYKNKAEKLLNRKQQLEYEMNIIFETEEGYNTRLILPEDMLYPEKIDALMNIIKSRNAKDIKEAIEIYQKNI